MNHTKMFLALAVLAAAVLAFGCNPATTPGGNGGSFTMNAQQKAAYDAVIAQVKAQAAAQAIPAQQVAQKLTVMNMIFASFDFKVVDTQKGKPIAQGTDENALKARFKPASL